MLHNYEQKEFRSLPSCFFVTPGTYRLAMSWHGGADIYASNTPVSVYSGSTLVGSATANQKLSPNDFFTDTVWWESLGIFTVSTSSLKIKVVDSANGYFMADAMRIERVDQSPGVSSTTRPIADDDAAYYTNVNTDLIVNATTNPKGLLANDFDLDSGTINASIVTNPASGSLIAFSSNGNFTYRPNAGFKEVDSFTYLVSDGVSNSSIARVAIAVGTPLLARSNRDSNVFANVPIRNDGLGTLGPIVDYASGGLIFSESITPSETLVYRSNSLTRPLISVSTRLNPDGQIPTEIAAQLTFNNIAGPVYSYQNTGLMAGQNIHFALQADGTNLATGMYDYTMRISTLVGGVTTHQFFSGKQAIVNRNNSEFGHGW